MLDKYTGLWYIIITKGKEIKKMVNTWYIITYISYGEHHDKEAYCVKEAAYKRYEQLCNCLAASNVKIRESKTLR